jgi:hemoglobin
MKRLVSLVLGAGLVLALAACTGQEKPSFPGRPVASVPLKGGQASPVPMPQANRPVDPGSLYARLGQRPGIEAVMTDFVYRVMRDRRINKRFEQADGKALIAKLTDQVCQASGGPCQYAGKDMKTAHAGMKISDREWNITGGHIVAAMRAKKVGRKEQQEVLALLTSMKGDIVGQ